MSQASENTAGQYATAIMVSKIWGDLIVNVKSQPFGAKGDWNATTGKGTDDTAAIQAAVNYALSKGKSDIWMPPGSYKYTTLLNTSGITFYGDNVTLHGTTVLNVTNFNDMRTRIENIIAGAGSDTEIVDARLPETGDAFATLKARLDAEHHALVDADSAMKAEYTDAIAALQTAYTVADNARSSRIDNLILNASGNVAEVVDARMPATGSPFTTLRNRLNATDAQLADIAINVKTLGAKGDGVTDDTAAIQAALNYVGTLGGGTVFFPAGTYIISSTLTVRANTYCKGAGMVVTKINWKVPSATVAQMIVFDTNNNVTTSRITDMSLDMKRAERSLLDDQSNGALIPRDNVFIERMRIHNTPGPGVTSSDINNVVVDSCEIYDTGHHNIYFSSHNTGYVKNVRITNNFLGKNGVIVGRILSANIIKFRHDLPGHTVQNVLIENNTLEPCTDTSIMIYFSTDNSSAPVCVSKDITIRNNNLNIEKSTANLIDTCIYHGSNSIAENFIIEGNYISGASVVPSYGIRLLFSDLANTFNVRISDNTIRNVDIGIDTRQSLIDRNEIINFTLYGIVGTSGKVIHNNIITSANNAVGVRQATFDVIENDITLTGTGTIGIDMANCSNLLFIQNHITSAAQGILRNGKTMTNCVYRENIFVSCAANYVNFTNSTATMKNNIFEPSSKIRSGATADRPTPVYVGEPYFDSTIRRAIFYNGANYFGDAMAAAPTTGVWQVGEIVWNTAPASAGFIGWVCTVAGSPGTWKTFGLIS